MDVLFRYCYIWKGNTKTAARMRPAATAAHVSTASMLMATSGEDDGVIGIANQCSPLRGVSPRSIATGIAANAQEPVDRSVVKYSEYLVWLFLITFSVEIDYRNRIRPVQYF